MMMTEKYYTLPTSSFCYSTFYQSSPSNRICEIKNQLNFQKKTSTIYEPNNMKLLVEQQPTVRTYSLYDVQERIDYFEKKKLTDKNENNVQEKVLSHPSSAETLQSVIANTLQQTFFHNEPYGRALSRTMMNSTVGESLQGKRRSLSGSHFISSNDQKRYHRYCSAISKRVRTYSLSNHPTMAITATTSFSEEQPTEPQETTSIDYENTYFYPEEATRFDDALSLTTITSNMYPKLTNTQHDASICSDTTIFQSDTDDNSEGLPAVIKQYGEIYDINMGMDLQNENNQEQIIRIRLSLTPPDQDFTGVVHATKYTIVKDKECLSDYDNLNHYSLQDNKIRSNVDNVSLNQLMTSSIQHDHYRRSSTDVQLNQQEKRTNDYNQVNHETIFHSRKIPHTIEMITQRNEDDVDDDDDDDGHYSDESNYSDELRYSSDAARNSCASDDLNNTSSTLRQEAISITRVRCKRRKTWIRSPTESPEKTTKSKNSLEQRQFKINRVQPLLSNYQVDETNASLNSTITTTKPVTSSALLSQTRVKTTMLLHKNSLNCNTNQKKNVEMPVYDFISLNNDHLSDETALLKTNGILYKDTPSPKYQSSLSPIKHLLNESIDSNIETIQMDEQECILEIVDGVLTIVPKDKSLSSSMGSEPEKPHNQPNLNYNSSNHQKQRSSSIASSVSTPSLSEPEQERDELFSTSSSRVSTRPYIIVQDNLPTKSQVVQSTNNTLDLFSTPINPMKTSPNDSLSSVSSNGVRRSDLKKQSSSIPRSSSPINTKPKSSSIKDTSSSSVENQTRSNKNTLLSQLLQTVKKSPTNNETEINTSKSDYPIPKTESLPPPKPINKDRINEFASLLSSSVHLSQQPQPIQKRKTSSTSKPKSSSIRSEEQSLPSTINDHDSYQLVKSNSPEQNSSTKHIDARYTEKLDDRGSIKINTANIKALFEQKISDTNKALSHSSEHLLHLHEVKQHHKKIPISYGSLKRNLPNYPQVATNNRRQSYHDSPTMNKYTDHIAGMKDVVIEDKQQLENGHNNNNIRRNTVEQQMVCSQNESIAHSPVSSTNGHHSESLIAREIRETKEKEDELKRQRKKCGFAEDGSVLMSNSMHDSIKSESISSTNQPVRSTSFLSNLDFFTSKANPTGNESISTISPSSRRLVNHPFESPNELKQMNNVVSQELNRFNENGMSIIRTSSTNGLLHRSTSNQNILFAQNTNNIIQREIEAIRAREAELRQLGRIQHTSDEHADPRKYQELVSTLPKSQSVNTISTGKIRRDSENHQVSRYQGPLTTTTNGFLKPKINNSNNSSISSGRHKLPSPNRTAPVVSSLNKTADYSKLSSTDRLELEKRQCQEREQELRKQRNSISASISSTNTTINGDSGNVSQEEHDDDQERYFDKIERIKRTENEKAHAPIIRPTKKLDMSQKWEQMMANKIED